MEYEYEHPQPISSWATLAAPNLIRWTQKADAYSAAWKDNFSTPPTSIFAVALGLSVAQHETWCGDAWPGEHNWGATQKRRLTPEEHLVLTTAGILPSIHTVQAARAAIAQAIIDGKCTPLDHEALHADSSPIHGWYFCYFNAYDTDEQGAIRFIHVLAGERSSCKQILDRANVLHLSGQAANLAAAMYYTKYYEGFHSPKTTEGNQANIRDYANAIVPLVSAITRDLKLAYWLVK